MANTHFQGPVYSTNGFVGDLTGNVTLPAAITATSLTSTSTLAVATTAAITGVATFTAQPVISSLTASSAVATDASKGLVSVTNTGTGNNVLAVSPVITGSPKLANPLITHGTPFAVNITGAVTGAQLVTAGGFLTSTSAGAVTLTLPTGTDLGGALGAVAGTVFEVIISNTAGANPVTVAVNTNAILSDAATTTAASFGQLTVASGVTGLARFTLMFSSATAYAFTRTA